MADGALIRCDSCRFWAHGSTEGLCRRHAPETCDRPYQVARWPETRAQDGCGEGERRAQDEPARYSCGSCAFWNRPGAGIDPVQRGDHLSAWWRGAGHCRRFAPWPGIEIGHHAYWRITHSEDGCFDGRRVSVTEGL